MIFEKVYGKWFSQELNSRVYERNNNVTCKKYSDVSFKPLKKNTNQVAVVVDGGGALRSEYEGRDMNTMTLNVLLICRLENADIVAESVEEIQKEYNAKIQQFVDKNDIVFSRTIFTTPITIDAGDLQTDKDGSVKVLFMSFTASIVYGTTPQVIPPVCALAEPEVFYLQLGGNEPIQITNLLSYEVHSSPSCDTYLPQGQMLAKHVQLSKATGFSFSIVKTDDEDDELQKYLEGELWHDPVRNPGGFFLFGKSIVLSNGEGKSFETGTYELTKQYSDGQIVYRLTLSR